MGVYESGNPEKINVPNIKLNNLGANALLNNAFKQLSGVATKAQNDLKEKGTLKLLDKLREGGSVSQAEKDLIGYYDGDKLAKFETDEKARILAQGNADRTFKLNQMKANAYAASQNPENKFNQFVAKEQWKLNNIPNYKSGGKSSGGGGIASALDALNTVLKRAGAEDSMDEQNKLSYAQEAAKQTNNKDILEEMFQSTLELSPLQDYFFGVDGSSFNFGKDTAGLIAERKALHNKAGL